MDKLIGEIFSELIIELNSEIGTGSDEMILRSKINGAYKAVKRERNYQEHHSQEFIDADMNDMSDIIKELALYDWNHIGGEGEISHSENGISRTWHDRKDILLKVTPFATVL